MVLEGTQRLTQSETSCASALIERDLGSAFGENEILNGIWKQTAVMMRVLVNKWMTVGSVWDRRTRPSSAMVRLKALR